LLQVTVEPGATVISPGAKAKFAIEIFAPDDCVLAATGSTTTLRGALPTAIVDVVPEARSTTVTSFDPSLVT
jgi:hypothetical protein